LFRRKELVIVVDGTREPAQVHGDLKSQLEQRSARAVAR
jgi:hypothetical protein